jgi:hypothetical protein
MDRSREGSSFPWLSAVIQRSWAGNFIERGRYYVDQTTSVNGISISCSVDDGSIPPVAGVSIFSAFSSEPEKRTFPAEPEPESRVDDSLFRGDFSDTAPSTSSVVQIGFSYLPSLPGWRRLTKR